jgi:hypothetical protein
MWDWTIVFIIHNDQDLPSCLEQDDETLISLALEKIPMHFAYTYDRLGSSHSNSNSGSNEIRCKKARVV